MKTCLQCHRKLDLRSFKGADGSVYPRCFKCRVTRANTNRKAAKEKDRLNRLDEEHGGDVVFSIDLNTEES